MLTSRQNPKVASAVRLRKRAFARGTTRRFLLGGAQAVGEALDAGRLETLFTTDEPTRWRCARGRRASRRIMSPTDVMRHLTSTVTPQALVGVAAFLDVGLEPRSRPHSDREGCVALLHEVRDPGTPARCCARPTPPAPGAVVFTETSVDVYNPKTVRASAGSIFHLPVVRGAETLDAIDRARALGLRVLAMASRGRDDLYRADLSGPVAFVFGNEAHGLPDEVVAAADASVRVPAGRPGGIAEPRRGGHRVPVRMGTAAPALGRGARDASSRRPRTTSARR